MFARLRPAARTLRQVRAYTATPVRAAPQVAAKRAPTPNEEGGKILLMLGAGAGALIAAGIAVKEMRSKHVHPSEPKEAEEEAAEEEEVEEVKEESAISAAADAALSTLSATAAAVDAELDALVSAAEAALGKTAASPAAGMPDPNEAASQGAFNEETGEINWDCPCLGGMAHGPCGEEFKAAFSCFVYSEQEPKGIDCVEKFKGMQECFRAHPDVYAEEIDDDDEAQSEAAAQETQETQETQENKD